MKDTIRENFREYLALHCGEQDLRSWFDPLSLYFNEEQRSITVFFPHTFFGTWFASGPQDLFSHAVHDFFGHHCCVIYKQKYEYKPLAHNSTSKQAFHEKQPIKATEKVQEAAFPDIASSTINRDLESTPRELQTPQKTSLTTMDSIRERDGAKNGINNKDRDNKYDEKQGLRIAKNFRENNISIKTHYRFENFIVNHKNTFPLTAAREAAIASRTRPYNPVLICGESGHGKSHLLGAMAHDLSLAMGPASVYCKSITDIEILYARAEKLVVRKHLMQREALLLDDIHLLCDLPHLHDEFICLFDYFLAAHKQMAFACTGGLALLQNISPALRSRLELGLILHLKEPDIDVRARFIQNQCTQIGLKLTREQILLLAQRCPSFRHTMGILVKISAYVDMVQHHVEDRELEKLLHHAESGRERKLSHKKIIEIVSDHFNMSSADILGNKRHKDIVFARQIAMFLCRELLGCSFPTLGRFFNGKDHSTTLYSFNKINKLQHDNKDTHSLVTELKKRCISCEKEKL